MIINYNQVQENIIPCTYFVKYLFLDENLKFFIGTDKSVNIYIDVKNALPTIHDPNFMNRILIDYNSDSDKYTIARTIVVLVNHWINYFKKQNINCNVFLFDDRGNSTYHNSINRNYKSNRKQSKQRIATELDINENVINKFSLIYDRNISLVSNLFQFIDNAFFIKLKDIESDFIPKLLMNELFTKEGKLDNSYIHIICSNDKDFGQLLTSENVIQLSRNIKNKSWDIKTNKNIMEYFIDNNIDKNNVLTNADFIPLILAVAGDKIDGFDGIMGVGKKRIFNYINELFSKKVLSESDYQASTFLEKIKEYSKIDFKTQNNKITKLLISGENIVKDNYKLASFKEFLNWLSFESKNKILKQLDKKNISHDELYTYLKQLCISDKSFKALL